MDVIVNIEKLLVFMFYFCLFIAITYIFIYIPGMKIYDRRLLKKAWFARQNQAVKHLKFKIGWLFKRPAKK